MEAFESARRAIEDAVVLMTQLKNQMSHMRKDQAEYLAGHEARLKQQQERDRMVDERIADLLLMIRRNPPIT